MEAVVAKTPCCQSVEVWGGDVRAEASQLAETDIVQHDHDHIGTASRGDSRTGRGEHGFADRTAQPFTLRHRKRHLEFRI